MGEYISLLVVAAGIVFGAHYANKKKIKKKAILPSVLVVFAILVVINFVKGFF